MQEVWRSVVGLLAYPHVWVRKAAGRLLGLLLANNKLGMTAYCLYLPMLLVASYMQAQLKTQRSTTDIHR